MPTSSIFTPEALALLRQQQRDAMPDVCYVLTPTIVRAAGAVASATFVVSRSFACRVSRQAVAELGDTRRTQQRTFQLSYPFNEAPLNGDETLIVVGDGESGPAYTRVLRISGAEREESFDTMRAAAVTDQDVPDIDPDDYIP